MKRLIAYLLVFFFFKSSGAAPFPLVRQLWFAQGEVSAEPRGHGPAPRPQGPGAGRPPEDMGNRLLFQAPAWEARASFFSFSAKLEEPEFQDARGVLPYLGGKLLLVCQTKQMWPGDNVYFHNWKQIG